MVLALSARLVVLPLTEAIQVQVVKQAQEDYIVPIMLITTMVELEPLTLIVMVVRTVKEITHQIDHRVVTLNNHKLLVIYH
jgi:hypothetical protein